MQTATITLGRNIGNRPMDDEAWADYHNEVITALEVVGASILADASYRGEWEGVPEEARIVLADLPEQADNPLREVLTRLARAFHQDAIGLTVGTGEVL